MLLVHAPTGDSELMFRGAPMSPLYAVSVLADRLERGAYAGWGRDDIRLYDPALTCIRDPARSLVELQELLRRHEPAVVCIGTTTHALYWALELARTIKRWRKDCIVILGGPHEDEVGAGGRCGSIAAHSDIVDFSIEGDAEYLLAELFAALHASAFDVAAAKRTLLADGALDALQGSGAISFSEAGGLRSVAIGGRYRPGLRRRASIPLDLDSLPLPPRRLLAAQHEYLFDIFVSEGRPKRTAQLMTTRGCNFGCVFCTERGALSHRGVANVMDEIHALAAQGYEAIFFDDSTLHSYPQLGELLDEIGNARDELNFELGGLTRVDSLLDNRSQIPLERFADAGFSYFYLGIEQDDDGVLDEMRKGYDSAKLNACLDLFRTTGQFRLGTSLLFGFGSETEASIERTLRLVATHPAIIIVNVSVVALHPAAVMAKSAQEGLNYDRPPPNLEPEWDLFEEGRWFHPPHIDLNYARKIHRLVRKVDHDTGGNLIRKLKRGGNVLGPRTLARTLSSSGSDVSARRSSAPTRSALANPA